MSASCTEWLEELERWMKLSSGFEVNRVYVRGTRLAMHVGEVGSLRHAVVSYFYGKLNLKYVEKACVFYGDLHQLFSDRERPDHQPFDLNRADILGLEVFVDGRVRFTLKSWNNFSGTFQGNCDNGLMYGFDMNHCFWVIDFAKTFDSV